MSDSCRSAKRAQLRRSPVERSATNRLRLSAQQLGPHERWGMTLSSRIRSVSIQNWAPQRPRSPFSKGLRNRGLSVRSHDLDTKHLF